VCSSDLKAFHITFTYDKPDYYGDAWASDLFLILRALDNEGCYQWGGYDYQVKFLFFELINNSILCYSTIKKDNQLTNKLIYFYKRSRPVV
jgi:hypothetical protein